CAGSRCIGWGIGTERCMTARGRNGAAAPIRRWSPRGGADDGDDRNVHAPGLRRRSGSHHSRGELGATDRRAGGAIAGAVGARSELGAGPVSDVASRQVSELLTPAAGREPEYLYLTTTGRVSRVPREIEIWFTEHLGRFYLVAEHGENAQWVRPARAVHPAPRAEVQRDVGGVAPWRSRHRAQP